MNKSIINHPPTTTQQKITTTKNKLNKTRIQDSSDDQSLFQSSNSLDTTTRKIYHPLHSIQTESSRSSSSTRTTPQFPSHPNPSTIDNYILNPKQRLTQTFHHLHHPNFIFYHPSISIRINRTQIFPKSLQQTPNPISLHLSRPLPP